MTSGAEKTRGSLLKGFETKSESKSSGAHFQRIPVPRFSFILNFESPVGLVLNVQQALPLGIL